MKCKKLISDETLMKVETMEFAKVNNFETNWREKDENFKVEKKT